MRAGITGHRDLGSPGTVAWIGAEMERTVLEHGVTHGFTALAAGADQLFAETLLGRSIPYTAVIPSASYEDSFDSAGDRERFRALRAAAAEVVLLPYAESGGEAFLAAGRVVVESSDIVIAVWDGEPARGVGGTGDIVAYATERNARVVHIDPGERLAREI